jgi:hypothetical protein
MNVPGGASDRTDRAFCVGSPEYGVWKCHKQEFVKLVSTVL